MATVCSVDSYIHPDLLTKLATEERILDGENPYGLVPGEAASAILVGHGGFMRGVPPLGQILRMTEATEPEELRSLKGIIGRGLASCFRFDEAVPVSRLIADLNGERYRAEELGFAATSAPRRMANLFDDPETPAANFGDIGAATGGAYAALALTPPPRWRVRPVDTMGREIAVISTSSRTGLRATLVVERSGESA
jgi:3-oxoacyl-[acyl-carrier-protein] synthase-1